VNSLTKPIQNNLIHIVCSIDKNYLQHCAVTITSIFSNTSTDNIAISIIYSNIDNESKTRLDLFIKEFTPYVKFILINEEDLKRFPISDHITLASYYRIFLADLIDPKIKKVLFLDCDLIIKKDLTPLWNIDISEYSHAAVIEYGVDNIHKESIGMIYNEPYFNAGVMLINLEYWRDQLVSQKAIQYIKQNTSKIKYWDQDVLNFVLQSKWVSINPSWNATGIAFRSEVWESCNFSRLTYKELTQASLDPYIIHFTGSYKPWHSYSVHPLKQEYYHYLIKTPWQDFKPIGKPSFIAKIILRLTKYLAFFKNTIYILLFRLLKK